MGDEPASGGRGDEWALRDGLPVVIRAIRPDDEPLLAAFHATLSAQSVYLRYFTPIELSRRVDHLRLYRICHADPARELVLVAERRLETGARALIAVGRLTRVDASDDTEFAVLVSDDFQGQGLGGELLRRLVAGARAWGARRVLAYILPENRHMLAVCERCGFRVVFDTAQSLLRAELTLVSGLQNPSCR